MLVPIKIDEGKNGIYQEIFLNNFIRVVTHEYIYKVKQETSGTKWEYRM